jgi:hypothetical protein
MFGKEDVVKEEKPSISRLIVGHGIQIWNDGGGRRVLKEDCA